MEEDMNNLSVLPKHPASSSTRGSASSAGHQKRQGCEAVTSPKDENASSFRDKICDYFEPRSSTSADLPEPSSLMGVTDGAFKGLFTGGAQALVGGAAGGYAGVKMEELTGSNRKALATGALTGAGVTVLAAGLLPMILGGSPSALSLYLLTMGAIGGVSGLTSTVLEKLQSLHRSDRPERDVQERGACLDYLSMNLKRFDNKSSAASEDSASRAFTGSKNNEVSQSVSSLQKALESLLGKHGITIASIIAGAVTGSLLAIPGGPPAMLVGSAVGAVNGFIGARIARKTDELSGQADKDGTTIGNIETCNKSGSGIKESGLATVITTAGGALAGAAALALLTSSPALALTLAATGLVGGLAGLSGTLAGSRKSVVRDGMSAGFMAGLITQSFTGTGSPLTSIMTGIAAGLGAQGDTTKDRALKGALYGAGIGAALGAFGGPLGAAVTAALGAGIASLAAVVGPKYGQGVKNLMEDIQKKLSRSAESLAEKLIDHAGPRRANMIAGGLSGAFTFGLTGFILSSMLGPVGFLIPAAAGAVVGAGKAVRQYDRNSASLKDIRTITEELARYGPAEKDMGEFIAGWLSAQGGADSVKGLTGEEITRRNDELLKQTMEKMAQSESEIQLIRENLGEILFAGLQKTIDALPTDEEKRKFLDRAIRKDNARLTAEMSARFVTMMSQIEQSAGFQEAPGKPHINPAA